MQVLHPALLRFEVRRHLEILALEPFQLLLALKLEQFEVLLSERDTPLDLPNLANVQAKRPQLRLDELCEPRLSLFVVHLLKYLADLFSQIKDLFLSAQEFCRRAAPFRVLARNSPSSGAACRCVQARLASSFWLALLSAVLFSVVVHLASRLLV